MAKKAKSASGAKKSAPAKSKKATKAAVGKSTAKASAKASTKALKKSSPKVVAKAVEKVSPKTAAKATKVAPAKETKKAKAAVAAVEPMVPTSAKESKKSGAAAKPAKVDSKKSVQSADSGPVEVPKITMLTAKGGASADEPELVELVGEVVADVGVESDDKKATEKKKKKDEIKIDRTGNLLAQWQLLYDRTKSVKALPYKMSEDYEARTPIVHKVLGWGYVLSSQNNRLEVLFKDGIKMLIANYKAS